MSNTSPPSDYLYSSSELAHTYNYLTNPLLKMLPAPAMGADGQRVRILDLGCGNGSFTHQLNSLGYSVVGIEESRSGIEIAQQSYPECEFRQGSIYDLSHPDLRQTFDAVVAVEVIEHLSNPRALVTAARYYLKPEGKFLLTTPYHGYLKNLALAITGKMDAHFTALWDGGHIKFFSVPTLTKLLQAEGCQNLHFEFAGRIAYLWNSMICSCNIN